MKSALLLPILALLALDSSGEESAKKQPLPAVPSHWDARSWDVDGADFWKATRKDGPAREDGSARGEQEAGSRDAADRDRARRKEDRDSRAPRTSKQALSRRQTEK